MFIQLRTPGAYRRPAQQSESPLLVDANDIYFVPQSHDTEDSVYLGNLESVAKRRK